MAHAEREIPRLPYVDAHARVIRAGPEKVWEALVATIGRLGPRLPSSLASALGLHPRARRGTWLKDAAVGDTVPGFAVATSHRSRLLVLAGGHRFSKYELHFELEPSGQVTTLRAETFAAFPGLRGTAYRALVISSGGHGVAVRRMLAQVARRSRP